MLGAFDQISEAPLEKSLLRPRLGQLESPRVGSARFIDAIEAPQQVAARRVVVAVVAELEAVEQDERGFRSFEFGHGDRTVHRHDRRAGYALESLVKEREPVAWLLEVEVGDRCLDGVGAVPTEGERSFQPAATFVDLVLVP